MAWDPKHSAAFEDPMACTIKTRDGVWYIGSGPATTAAPLPVALLLALPGYRPALHAKMDAEPFVVSSLRTGKPMMQLASTHSMLHNVNASLCA
jgi:hypothetical protein